MRFRVCGGRQEHRITDMPFKATESSIIIIKALPVLQCRQCGDTELEDQIMAGCKTNGRNGYFGGA